MSIGNSPEILSQAILVGIILVGRLGVHLIRIIRSRCARFSHAPRRTDTLVSTGGEPSCATTFVTSGSLPVSVKKTLPGKNALGKSSFQSTKSGAGEQFLLQDCRAKAAAQGMFLFTDTGMGRSPAMRTARARAWPNEAHRDFKGPPI